MRATPEVQLAKFGSRAPAVGRVRGGGGPLPRRVTRDPGRSPPDPRREIIRVHQNYTDKVPVESYE